MAEWEEFTDPKSRLLCEPSLKDKAISNIKMAQDGVHKSY